MVWVAMDLLPAMKVSLFDAEVQRCARPRGQPGPSLSTVDGIRPSRPPSRRGEQGDRDLEHSHEAEEVLISACVGSVLPLACYESRREVVLGLDLGVGVDGLGGTASRQGKGEDGAEGEEQQLRRKHCGEGGSVLSVVEEHSVLSVVEEQKEKCVQQSLS